MWYPLIGLQKGLQKREVVFMDNGLAFALNELRVKQITIAKELNVSRATINKWVNDIKPIPEERAKEIVEKIPEFKGIDYKILMKKSLSPTEQIDIQIIALQNESEPIEIEDSYIDENGIEHKYPVIHYPYESEIKFLHEERDRIKHTEELIKKINFLIYTDDRMEQELSFGHGGFIQIFQDVVNVLSGDRKRHAPLMILLEMLTFDIAGFGNPYFHISGKENKQFAKELVALLLKYKYVDNEFFIDGEDVEKLFE